ncbi:MAG: J domain-containing protein [bacterium]
MKNPFKVLQVLSNATDDEIKEAYIRKVKQYSPERFPHEFMEIREAYEKISTLKKRIHYRLFTVEDMDPHHIKDIFIKSRERNRIHPKELINAILKKYQQTIVNNR